MRTKAPIITAGLLATALFVASPVALADHHGGKRAKPNWDEMCQEFRDGKGRFNAEQRRAEMAKRHAELADRLKLTDEQREIWDQIRDEKRARHEDRMERWQQKMEKHCDRM